ncbi:hypothetical protein MSAN_01931500 [Mycena sanguinolenta]|uniref:DUF6534 domain-containing protein n=1 Tax=Mycena sanguinolenta TaxID=230812 RepID=A0A8H6XQ90_9AGAR|nr:hypothetical protein MSAN_01931500 [Mycena sanguinolenta]
MSMTLPRLDSITGAPLIGTWASTLLYMAELLQALNYFRDFKKDNWKLKSYVAVAFAIDTISAIGDCACVYLYTITHADDFAYLTKQNWAVPLYIISTSCVAILVQSFLAFRYWNLTNNTIVVCFLSILILAAFGGGFWSGLAVVLFPAFKDRNKVRASRTVFIVTQVSADLLIAWALVGEFMKAKSSVKGQRRINNALNRLLSHTIQTGTMAAVITVLALAVSLMDDQTNIPTGIMFPLGRVYVLSMLITLNIRDSGRHKNRTISAGQSAKISSVQFRHTSEPESSNSGSDKSSALLPTSQSTASISSTRPPDIEMVPVDTKVPEV